MLSVSHLTVGTLVLKVRMRESSLPGALRTHLSEDGGTQEPQLLTRSRKLYFIFFLFFLISCKYIQLVVSDENPATGRKVSGKVWFSGFCSGRNGILLFGFLRWLQSPTGRQCFTAALVHFCLSSTSLVRWALHHGSALSCCRSKKYLWRAVLSTGWKSKTAGVHLRGS